MPSKILSIPYFSQLDNWDAYHGTGHRQCNLTTHAALLDYILKRDVTKRAVSKKLVEAEDLYGQELAKYGDTINHDAHSRLLEDYGIISSWGWITLDQIIASINADLPVPIGVAYKVSGHIILVIGYDLEKKCLIVNDPYGRRNGAADSYDTSVSGERDTYSFNLLNKVFFDLDPKYGKGRIITSIKGQPTGLSPAS